jgi:acetolactate synthase-1/2/3 large subunit
MSGARALVRTLIASGVDVCFTNPGTSEIHFVAALDAEPGMRAVLGLFEGVVTGAADGYARMSGRPACTLLHLGPGLANGIANLHNARRARVPLVSIVGEHATYHRALDAPLTSDIEGVARTVSSWVRTSRDAASVAADGAQAVAASYGPPGQVATLILPADVAWNAPAEPAAPVVPRAAAAPDGARVEALARTLRAAGAAGTLLMNGSALSERGLELAGKVAATTGARLFTDTFVTRQARGAGRVDAPRLPYLGEQALALLQGTRHLVLVGTKAPVSFFAYPGKPSELTPEGCAVHGLAEPDEDGAAALAMLVEALGATAARAVAAPEERPPLPTGALTPDAVAQVLAHLLPDHAIVVNEAATAGRSIPAVLARSAPHDWLDLMGGAIGQGMPAATGAAIACPDRKVISLEADGSGMYTLQSLWTQAREGLDVTTVVFSNRRYAILEMEYRRVGAGDPSAATRGLFELSRPDLDWVSLARGMGVDGARATTAEELARGLRRGLETGGPHLIEAIL